MTIYAIGDVQGCYVELEAMLKKIKFEPKEDKLYFVGDLVNRGPNSLETLRFVKNLGNVAATVLGNHDLHLIAVAKGIEPLKSDDTFQDILQADDCDELISWLIQQPLLQHVEQHNVTITHAGVYPTWDFNKAKQLSDEVSAVLQSDQADTLLANMYGDQPELWSDDLKGIERWRFIINAFTRMRYLTLQGGLDLTEKRAVKYASKYLTPWYECSPRKMEKQIIIFGHWAALKGISKSGFAVNIDTGVSWGEKLTAIRVDNGKRYGVISRKTLYRYRRY